MEKRAAYLSKQESDKFYPTLPPKYSMLKHFDVIQKLVPSKDHYNTISVKTRALNKKKITILDKFPKTYVSETGCHGNMINHMDIVIGQFRIVQRQKNRVEVQGNNLHFPLF